MSLIKVSTCKQPVQHIECNAWSKLSSLYECGRISLDIGNKTGIDHYSGIYRYILDEGKYVWLPVKEHVEFDPPPKMLKPGVACYYAETMSAGHPERLRGFAKFEGQLFV